MVFKMHHKKYSAPQLHIKNNQNYYEDPIREKKIKGTDEEFIRQITVRFLKRRMCVPSHCIDIEVPLARFKRGASGRADIVVFSEARESDAKKPILIVECKKNTLLLSDDHNDQVCRYDKIIKARNIAITNGDAFIIKTWDSKRRRYSELNELPTFNVLLSSKHLSCDTNTKSPWKRVPFKNMVDKNVLEKGIIDMQMHYEQFLIGQKNNFKYFGIIANLAGCLFDDRHKLPTPIYLNGVRFVEDKGLRKTSFGNSSGGSWHGHYRRFKITYGKTDCIFGLSVIAGSGGWACLVVSIDNEDCHVHHHSLQLNIEKYAFLDSEENKYRFFHDGTMTMGNIGRIKNQEVIRYISKMAPELIVNDKTVFLGCLSNIENISLKKRESQSFIANLAKYALLRDNLRKRELDMM